MNEHISQNPYIMEILENYMQQQSIIIDNAIDEFIYDYDDMDTYDELSDCNGAIQTEVY